ncbi:MAG: hypothetical protein A3B89_02790 [Candidatus Buchananbacteria bacterium RIFCSPHIGHO2_02_FULL_40_13]|uniref:Uncharacterized protein n=1 Tax=Candidatus Buchananbacteria bacterium RIFCSPLOWO2_01_FULL_39_33 TaxID=1797543 RepID=A0A1G1YHY8_9BACT|nr:MAG: hypothetical protein A2820_02200 [Candidatus Buchananbacteria bacterium RIFCSPHIGHO2_01_FULL_40_35]OGY49930.1 MAG: hypothetical protein A3B89_02790 [Candidatus Buchananbacteria bacterium RIFCSPHIGHO2_02_FULL_40_13]OGY51929.1 MAG: hypothetical protein A3A02_01290 [Candidatus Buchananbacteria bacterium RIFCSPLOWO2_01_FULL_39_33]
MFITVHAAAATVIGKNISSPIIAFLLGLLSHLILDLIPHGDSKMGKRFWGERLKFLQEKGDLKFMALYGSIDSFVLAVFLIFLFKNFEFARADNVIWAIIGSILPDVLVAVYKLKEFRIIKWFYKLHNKNHNLLVNKLNFDLPLQYGILVQVIILTVIIWTIYLVK